MLLLVPQLVAFQKLIAVAGSVVHDATGTFVVLFGVQVVAVQLLPEVAGAGAHVCT